MDLEQLKILEKMVARGLSEEEAKKAVIADEMDDKLNDFLANCDISIDSEEGPLPGTRNKGLCTIKIPLELQDAAYFDESKTWVDNVKLELLMSLAAQQLKDNEQYAQFIADYTYQKFGKPEDFLEYEEEVEQEFIDKYNERYTEKRIVKRRKQKHDQLGEIRDYLNKNGSPLENAMRNYKPPDCDEIDPDAVVTYEQLEDGTWVKVITNADGTVTRKIADKDDLNAIMAHTQGAVDDFIANAVCDIDDDEGPLPGTRSKGLTTLNIPMPGMGGNMDPSKILVDKAEQEMFKLMAQQQQLENPEGAAAIARQVAEKYAKDSDFEMVEEIDEFGNVRMVRKLKKDPLAGLKKDNEKGESPLAKALKANKDPNVAEEYEEILADGTRVKVKRMADGRIVREVVPETAAQKEKNKLKAMKDLANKEKELAQEEEAIKHAERELKKKEENIKKLKEQREKLKVKEKFQIPGGIVKGKIFRKDKNGNWVEVDVENEDLDDNESLQEQIIDKDGNITYKKIEKSKIKEINKYKQEYKGREKARLEKLAELDKEINKEEAELSTAKAALDQKKKAFEKKKEEIATLKKVIAGAAPKGQKQVVVKVIKDGVKAVMGKDGKMR